MIVITDLPNNSQFLIGSFVLVAVIFLVVYGRYQTKLRKEELRQKLKQQYGELPKREYEDSEFASISHYFHKNKKKKPFYIDDITWNDLDMDRIFIMLNNTQSSAGEEYLYDRLRTPGFEENELEELEELICYFDQNETERMDFQENFHALGHSLKISLSSYIESFQQLEKRSNLIHYICILLFVASVGLFFANPALGVMAFIATMIFNIVKYYAVRARVESYFICISYIIRLVKASLSLGKRTGSNNYPSVLKQSLHQLQEHSTPLQGMIRGSFLIAPSSNYSGNILEMVMEYVRMLLHIDLIAFNHLLSIAKEHKDDIEILLEHIGKLETAIAVASYRRTLPFYAIPKLKHETQVYLRLENGYHPLLREPVANSIEESKSVLLTGSNASGKSTFLKTVALAAILAQTIHTVLGESYTANFFKTYSSMALRDKLEENESYYIVEIKSLKRIMDDDRKLAPVLCFVDEVLRGTNTVERVAASAHILYHLSKQRTMCFAATHDIELTHLLEKDYSNYHFKEDVVDNDIKFNYILNKGRATTRNAIKLLQIMEYDPAVIRQAERTAQHFVESGEWRMMQE